MPNKQLTCKLCGKPYIRKVTPSAIKQGHKFDYCSPSCRNKARSLEMIHCPICGTLFKPSRINGTKGQPQRYCSRPCASIARRGTESSKKTPRELSALIKEEYPKGKIELLMKSLKMTKSAIQQIAYKVGVKLHPSLYRQRVHESARQYMKTPNNPNWKGGISNNQWGDNWNAQRRATLKRDNSLCQICFTTGRSVHHIKPRRLFIGHMEDANDLSNLITLCAKHHLLVECGKVPCPSPR